MIKKYKIHLMLLTALLLSFILFLQKEKVLNSENNKSLRKKEGQPIADLKSLQIGNNKDTKLEKRRDLIKKKKSRKLGEQKTSFKIMPGPDILNQYEKNEGDIKKTMNDFKEKPSVQAEVKVSF